MVLPGELVSELVKVTTNTVEVKKETTTYGTIVEYEGSKYVRLDGSDLLTPVTLTTDVKDEDRVTVMIKNHTAIVTGNISSPAARSESVEQIGDRISEAEILIADKVSTKYFDAEVARIDALTADNVTIKDQLNAQKASIDDLEAENVTITGELNVQKANIEELETNKLSATDADLKYATITELDATNADIHNLEADYGEFVELTAKNFEATNATIENLEATKIDAAEVNAKYATIANLDATYATIANLDVVKADIETLESDYGEFKTLTANKFVANDASIKNLQADKLSAADADIKYATITQLDATNANVGSLKTDVADIDSFIFGSASGDTIQTSFANAVIAQLGNAQIKSAMIESLSASKITSGDIVTNNVRVMSEDGSLIISDETIQIKDEDRVRVQIGKDASGDYSINIWDDEGTLMFSEGGITDGAIKSAIIRNDMVSDTANISASKLDISSLFTVINGSTETINATRIYLDDESQTLDVAFTSMSSDLDETKSTVNNQGTQLSVIQGQINSKVWQQDIDEATGVLNTKYSALEQDINSISATVATHSTTLSEKADSTTVTAISDKVAKVETDLSGFKSTVSETYATKETIEGVESDIDTLSNNHSSLVQTVNGISATVTSHTTQIKSKADSSAVTSVENKVSSLESSLNGFRTTVSETYAEKTDVDDLSERFSTAETNIQQNKNSIELTVEKVDSIDVGGRNLLRKSDASKWIDEWLTFDNSSTSLLSDGWVEFIKEDGHTTCGAYPPLISTIPEIGKYVLSFEAYATSAVDINYIYIITADGANIPLTKTVNITTEPTRYEIVLTLSDTYDNCSVMIASKNSAERFYIREIMLESGNLASDWTPAPEDIDANIVDVRTEMISRVDTSHADILMNTEQIILTALESYVQTSNYDEFKKTVESQLSVMADAITMNFTTTTEQINDVNGDLQSRFSELHKYIKYSGDTAITIGSSDSAITLEIDNEIGIIFKKNGVQFGWWDGFEFHTGNIVVEVNERAQFGNFAFVPRSDGSLMFLKVGG